MAKNYTKKDVLEAIDNSAGVMEYVAVRLGCTWRTARKYVDKWEETEEAFEASECRLHALAYKSFHTAIKSGERWAVERILDTSARRNGHGMVDHKQVDLKTEDVTEKLSDEDFKAKLKELGIEC